MSALPPEEVERRKTLRRERNRRSTPGLRPLSRKTTKNLKVKHANTSTWVDEQQHDFPHLRPYQTDRHPTSSSRKSFSWDFHSSSHLAYRMRVREELQEAIVRGEVEEWVGQKERWIDEGDRILQMLRRTLGGSELLFTLPEDVIFEEFEVLSEVAYELQYQLATVEVFLDSILPEPVLRSA
ncbi:hypothetical protein L226DRAFT_527600 [Lentinus tigrinus ALCF2SS1-7]|uniref:Uncharacterized protein n=1 Tax=Lentinus tigrinus ALCF2SS1-6 TaxID=1328759 RepID=A0A5C2RM54_9APHY|nr:hypothetical protein L227DRAFT_568628 [Lentinus tigrinus ALCF2SS1-6]RPD67863.1 hypothetical protein L226DRAFT_527600 [Lentinus tigrinus ALCF2SS1-7]